MKNRPPLESSGGRFGCDLKMNGTPLTAIGQKGTEWETIRSMRPVSGRFVCLDAAEGVDLISRRSHRHPGAERTEPSRYDGSALFAIFDKTLYIGRTRRPATKFPIIWMTSKGSPATIHAIIA